MPTAILQTSSAPPPPSIYAYDDLSAYLRAFTEHRKAKNPRWSLGLWSRRLQIKGRGTLSNFIAGRRVPKEEIVARIRLDLGLSEYEQIYFDALVVSSAKKQNPVVRRMARNLLLEEKSGDRYKEIGESDFSLIADPLYLVLREAVKVRGFRADPAWISRRFRLFAVSPKRIEQALSSLVASGHLAREAERLVQREPNFKTPIDSDSEALKAYYEASLELNRRAVREVPRERRHFNSVTLCCEPEQLEELKEMVHAFSRRLLERFDRPEGKIVYQLHTQLVPHFEGDSDAS